MSKYVFGCTVKSVTRNSAIWSINVVPTANYCVRRSVAGKIKTFAAILPLDDADVGFAIQYDETIVVDLSKCRMHFWSRTVELEFEDSPKSLPPSSMGKIEFEKVKDSESNPRGFSITKLTMM